MKHLTDIYDPKRKDAKSYLTLHLGETVQEAWKAQEDYLADKVIGRPQATEANTVEELESFGLVGVYEA